MAENTTRERGIAVSETEQETQPEQENTDEPVVDEDPDQTEGVDAADENAAAAAEAPLEQLQDVEMEKAFSRIERSFGTYKAAVERNLEDQITEWLFCPLCSPGAIPGYFNRHDLGRVPEEVQANVMTVLGYARETEYPPARGVTECDVCTGLGKVKTGSRVAEHMTITCPTCKGYGYMPPPGFSANTPPTNGEASHAVAEALAELEQPERDNWGEPKTLPDGTLNSNYGKQPQFKSVHPVYGVTNQLTPEELVSG